MSRADLEREVLAVFRETALAGSAREVALDAPLGEAGLGLDSLALVSFVTALEKRFAVRFSDELWTDRGQVSLRSLAASIERERGALSAALSAPAAAVGSQPAAPPRFAERVARRLARQAYARRRYLLLARDLAAGPLPEPGAFATPPLTFRRVSAEELASLPATWPQFRRRFPIDDWRAELAAGATCLAALRDGEIVALDWLSGTGEERSSMGLPIRVRPGTSYGFRLLERPDVAGQGVGLSLLAHSLGESRRGGFARQVTYVDERNQPMILAARLMLGFQPAGEVEAVRLFGLSRARWRVDGREGTGGTLLL